MERLTAKDWGTSRRARVKRAVRREPVRWIGLLLNVLVNVSVALEGQMDPSVQMLLTVAIVVLTELARDRVTPV
jgi:uncharacterized membrane protein